MKVIKLLVCNLFIISYLGLFAEEKTAIQNEAGEFKMTLLLESENPIIKEYEIEFWKEVDNKNSKELPIQRLLKPGRNVISAPAEYNFFRVRAVAKLNIRGYWTDYNPIKRYPLQKEETLVKTLEVPKPIPTTDLFLKIPNSAGIEDLYLVSPQIQINDSLGKNSSIFYKLDQMLWQKLDQDKIKIDSDGTHSLEYYGIDLLGNKEQTKHIAFLNDQTAPESNLQFSGELFSNYQYFFISGNAKIKIISTDNFSGIENTYFRYGCQFPLTQEWSLYQNEISLKSLLESKCIGKMFFEYYSRDKVGNTESTNIKEIQLTKSADD